MIRKLANSTHWIGGILVAFVGTALTHWPAAPGTMIWTVTGGRLLALAGLGWIAIGISRRAARKSNTL